MRSTAIFPGLSRRASTRKVKPIWILMNLASVSSSGISWAICKSAPLSRQITTPAPHHSVFLQARCHSCRPTKQCQSTEGKDTHKAKFTSYEVHKIVPFLTHSTVKYRPMLFLMFLPMNSDSRQHSSSSY